MLYSLCGSSTVRTRAPSDSSVTIAASNGRDRIDATFQQMPRHADAHPVDVLADRLAQSGASRAAHVASCGSAPPMTSATRAASATVRANGLT
jgi:hypothetical protein